MPLFGPPNVEKLKAKGDIKGLIKALSYQKDDAVRQAATEALADIGALAVDPLITALKDSKAHNAAIEALTSIGLPAVEPLIVSVKQWDSEGLESAVLSFNEVMEVNLATAADTKALELRTVGIGWIILEKCSDDDPATESIGICIPPMDEKSTALTAAADVLGRIGASAVEPLLGALKLKDNDWRVRVGAAQSAGTDWRQPSHRSALVHTQA